MTTPHEHEEAFYCELGDVIATWAEAETLLDYAIYIIHTRAGGNTKFKELPKFIVRKIEYVRKCHRQLPALADIPQGFAVADEFARLREERHFLTHGIPFTIKMESIASKVAVVRLQHGPERHTHEEKPYDLPFLMQMSEDTRRLSRDSLAYVKALMAKFSPDEIA